MSTLLQLVALTVRIGAIFLFVWSLSAAATYLPMSMLENNTYKGVYRYFWWVVIAIPFVIAFIMWKLPFTIARIVLPSSKEGTPLKDLPIDQIQVSALTVIGVAIMAIEIPDLIAWATYYLKADSAALTNTVNLAENLSATVATIVAFAIGLWLSVGGKGIIAIIKRLRLAGQSRNEP